MRTRRGHPPVGDVGRQHAKGTPGGRVVGAIVGDPGRDDRSQCDRAHQRNGCRQPHAQRQGHDGDEQRAGGGDGREGQKRRPGNPSSTSSRRTTVHAAHASASAHAAGRRITEGGEGRRRSSAAP
jgi:hypothetical protein